MRLTVITLSLAAATAVPAFAQITSNGLWSSHYHMGETEYSTGEIDQPTGGQISISCAGKVALLSTQIKGKAPPANSSVRLVASSRDGSVESRFTTGGNGAVRIADAAASAEFRRLWANLRARDIVTIRYPDGQYSVQSLAGAQRTLPRKPCG
jgi:hypothetical protein